MNSTIRINREVPAFTKGRYHMNALLIDCQGNQQLIECGPDTVIKADDYFAPCGGCGVAVLMTHWHGERKDNDFCALCSIQMPDSEPTTLEEATMWLDSCIKVFGAAFHPDNSGFEYVNTSGERTFTDEEAMFFDNNRSSTFVVFRKETGNKDALYAYCMEKPEFKEA